VIARQKSKCSRQPRPWMSPLVSTAIRLRLLGGEMAELRAAGAVRVGRRASFAEP
jgi:hypothetical protein